MYIDMFSEVILYILSVYFLSLCLFLYVSIVYQKW